jgi:hypothetical protein
MTYTIQLTEQQLHFANFNQGKYNVGVDLYSDSADKLYLDNNLNDIILIKDLKQKLNIKSGTVLEVSAEGIIDLTKYVVKEQTKPKAVASPKASGSSAYMRLSQISKNR